MTINATSKRIPFFLKAKTPENLRNRMLKNNINQGKEYKYFDIGFANGYWFAWFYEVAELKVKK